MSYHKDYPMTDIASWETIAGVEVPLDSFGHYLDWNDISEDRKQARTLTSPYGSLHFAIGFNKEDFNDENDNGDWMVCFDFAALPDGNIVIDAVCNSDSGGFIMGIEYDVIKPEDAPQHAIRIASQACDGCYENDGYPDEKGWNQDPYYLARSIAQCLGIEPYASMSDADLRFGPFPDDLQRQ